MGIAIRELIKEDIELVNSFMDFYNPLIQKDAPIFMTTKVNLDEEIEFLKQVLDGIKKME